MDKHYIFDMGNVLVDFDLQVVRRCVMDAAGADVFPDVLKLQDTAKVVEVETGVISSEQYVEHICELTGLQLTLEQLIGVWREGFTLNAAGMALFDDLLGQGLSVHILSNIAWHNEEAVKRNWPGFFDRAHSNFLSYEMGFHKPDKRIYRLAVDRLGAAPENCFFLDDKPENVEGARAVGMDAHVFGADRLPDIREALERFCA